MDFKPFDKFFGIEDYIYEYFDQAAKIQNNLPQAYSLREVVVYLITA
jgi:hypothetical protein